MNDQQLRTDADQFGEGAEFQVIEGAGGLMCPLSDSTTVLTLAQQLNAPVIVVAANKLGVINHTCLTVQVAQDHGLTVQAVVLNQTSSPDSSTDESLASNADQLRQWLPGLRLLMCRWNEAEIRTHGQRVVNIKDLFEECHGQ